MGRATCEGLKSLARETVQGTEEGDTPLPQVVRQDNPLSEGIQSLVPFVFNLSSTVYQRLIYGLSTATKPI